MKKIFTLSIFLIFTLGMAQAQRVMHVNRTNGTTDDYELDYVTDFSYPIDYSWISIGTGTMTEGILWEWFAMSQVGDMKSTWDVEIQEKQDTPGLYRVVNPYKDYEFNWVFESMAGGAYDSTQNYYLEIDATDPDLVWIETPQDTGLNCGSAYGEFYIWSAVAYWMTAGYTWEEEIAYGDFGTLRDGVITFPCDGLIMRLGSTSYQANYYENFRLVLPQN